MTRILCIGGPKHGQSIEVPDDLYYVKAIEPVIFDMFDTSITPEYSEHTYRKVKFGARTESEQGFRYVLVVNGMDEAQAGIELRDLLAVRWALGKALT